MQMLETLYLMENVHGEGHTVRTWHGVESQPPYIIQVCSRGRLLTRFYTGIIPLCVRMVSHWFCSRGFTQVSHGFTLFYMVLRGFRIDITRAFFQRWFYIVLQWFCSRRFYTALRTYGFTLVLLTPVLHGFTRFYAVFFTGFTLVLRGLLWSHGCYKVLICCCLLNVNFVIERKQPLSRRNADFRSSRFLVLLTLCTGLARFCNVLYGFTQFCSVFADIGFTQLDLPTMPHEGLTKETRIHEKTINVSSQNRFGFRESSRDGRPSKKQSGITINNSFIDQQLKL